MSAHYIAAVDQGTTSTRCMIFDRQGRMVALAQREHRQYYPHSGWVEHDAAEIWSVVQRLLPQALHDAGVGPEQIADDALDRMLALQPVGDHFIEGGAHAPELQLGHQLQNLMAFHLAISAGCHTGRNRRPVRVEGAGRRG